MNRTGHFMTVRGKKLIEEELEQLIKGDREKTKKAISEARELGDLKENAEYHAAKEKQSQIEGRIMQLQGKLNNAVVVDINDIKTPDKIVFGATVKIFDIDKEESYTYQIVGADEAKEKGKISIESPLGRALIGKEEGDIVQFNAPKGEIEYEIESIQYI